MSIFRDSGTGRSDPDEPVVGHEELRRSTRYGTLDVGTLACARCDAPIALAGRVVAPRDVLSCPYCLHSAPVRDCLVLGEPTRPMRVVVRVAPVAPVRQLEQVSRAAGVRGQEP